jgi:hypothetical protein
MALHSSLLFLVTGTLERWRAHRHEIRIRRLLADLSPQTRKDIGWPDTTPRGRHRRQPSDGFWL